MLNVRLDKDLEESLKQYSLDHNMSKSSVVKEALVQYFTKKEVLQNPFALGKDLFGTEGSGTKENSSTYRSRLKSKLNEKYSH